MCKEYARLAGRAVVEPLSIVQAGGVLSRLGGGRAAAWLLVAVFAVLGTVAVLRTNGTNHSDGAPGSTPSTKAVQLPGSIPLAALPTPLPDESATGGSPTGELTIIDPPGPAARPVSSAPGPSGIPGTLYAAYQHGQQVLAVTAPACHLGWGVLAAIGRAESGQAQGGRVDARGRTLGRILGPRLDGSAGLPRAADTDHGRLDGDPTWDRAVGPMQIVPSVWQRYGADGDGDGIADPNDVFDAALTAGRYLCTGGMDLSNQEQRTTALYRYNQSDSFVSAVRSWADGYGQGATSVPVIGPAGPPAAGPVPLDAPAPGYVAPLVQRPASPTHRSSVPARRAPEHHAPRHHAPGRAAHPTTSAPATGGTESTADAMPNSPDTPLTPDAQPNAVVPAPSDRASSNTPATTSPSTTSPDTTDTTSPSTSAPSTSVATPTTTSQPPAGTRSSPNTIWVRPVPASELPPFTPIPGSS